MPWGPLADAVLLAHAAFVAFVVAGGLLVLRWPRAAWLHLPVVAWGAGIEFTGGICPLTPLENELRVLAQQQGYAGGFVEHYVFGLLYPDGLTRNLQLALGLLVLLVNGVIYGWAWRRRRARRAASGTPDSSAVSGAARGAAAGQDGSGSPSGTKRSETELMQ